MKLNDLLEGAYEDGIARRRKAFRDLVHAQRSMAFSNPAQTKKIQKKVKKIKTQLK